MTIAEFQVAASKGQGRAIQELRDGEVHPSFRLLRRLILRWPGYDWQCETSRGWYTAELMRLSSCANDLSASLVQQLPRIKGLARHRHHRESVACELAKRGVEPAKKGIYAHFDPANAFRFADHILTVDGLEGLDWLISKSSDRVTTEDVWRFKWWVSDLRDSLGENVVTQWLAYKALTRPDIAELARLVAAAEAEKRPEKPKRDASIPFEEFSDQWHLRTSSRPSAVMWAHWATQEELAKAWRSFEEAHEPDWLGVLARGLSRIVDLVDIDKLVVRALEWKAERNPFVIVLERVIDPRVRLLGFELIAAGWTVDGIALFGNNGLVEDVPFLLNVVRSLEDADHLHFVGMDLLRLPTEPGFAPIFEWIAEMTPCSLCRNSAVRDLIEINAASDALLKECFFDCDEDTRDMAAKALGSLQ